MKSVMTKVLALLLATLMVLPLLVACGVSNEGKEPQGDSQSGAADSGNAEEDTKAPPTVPANDYDEDFYAIYCSDTFRKGYFFIEEDERKPGNDMDDRVYERIMAVEEYLGVNIVSEDGGIYTEYAEKVKNTITAGDDSYQLVLTHVYEGVSNFITENHARPFNDFDSVNIEAEYWNLGLMESLAINDNMYLGYNDFCLSDCYVIGFNKSMVNDYSNTIGDLYEQVNNRKWTMEKFIEYSSLVSEDNGDGVWDANDTYGFAGFAWVPLISFQLACDIPFIQENSEGELYVSPLKDNKEKIVDLDQMLYDFAMADYTYMWSPGAAYQGPTEALNLSSNRVMFETINIYSLITTKEEEVKVGVMPYPMWDEKQADYKTMSWNGVMVIPTTVQDMAMVGDVVEMFAYYSDPVTTAFYETLLGAKVAEAPADVQMLDIIWSTLTSDIGLTFNGICPEMDGFLYALPHHISVSGVSGYTSNVGKRVKAIEKALGKLFDDN